MTADSGSHGLQARSIVIVGGGPRGSGLLERLVANAPELLGDAPLDVHVVEPFTMGAGRIWRYEQSPLLRANSQAEDTTMFTDSSCRIAGPVLPGPTFQEWAHLPAADRQADGPVEAELAGERAGVGGMTFASRRLLTGYLTWVFRRTVAQAPENLRIHLHRDRAVDVTDEAGGRQLVHLADGSRLTADVVLLAQGHLSTLPLGPSAATGELAAAHGLTHLAEEYTADSDLAALLPGQDVIVRGAGLACIDLVVLLTQGRGGRFVQTAPPSGGRAVPWLRYEPAGTEPRLHIGSRRGVPYHSKLSYRLQGPPAPHPRILTPEAVDRLLGGDAELDFRSQVWPLLVRELAFGHYHELFAAHPERVHGDWAAVETALAGLAWRSPELEAAIAAAVPDPADRFDPAALDRPLRGVRLPDRDALQQHLTDYIAADLARRGDPEFSADLGVFNALLAVFEPLGTILASGRLSLTSAAADLPWFISFFSYLASGPPPRRLAELQALLDAGVISFLGADVEVTVEPATPDGAAAFVASSPTVPGELRATALVEARVPRASVSGTADPLLATLYRRGDVAEQVLTDAARGVRIPTGRVLVTQDTGRLVDAAGQLHPARHAFGSGTSAATPGAFSRPGTDAAFFRQNDHAVRAVLTRLAQLDREPTTAATLR